MKTTHGFWIFWFRLTIDLVLLALSFAMAMHVRFADLALENSLYYDYYVQLFFVLAVSYALFSLSLKGYDWPPGTGIRSLFFSFAKTVFLQGALVALVLVSLKGYVFSRLFWLYFYLFFFSSAVAWRFLAWNYLQFYWSRLDHAQKGILIGSGRVASLFLEQVKARPDLAMRIVLQVESPKDLPQHTEASYVFCANVDNESLVAEAMDYADHRGLRFRILPDFGQWGLRKTEISKFGPLPMIYVRPEPLRYWHNRWIKRSLDVVISAVIIGVFLWWLVPLMSCFVRWTSSGPGFFKQERHGLNGQTFVLWKLRTMRVNGEAHTKESTPGDSRITPLGRFLRWTWLDELPQFFHVFKGTMSVVGPRPHMVSQAPTFQERVKQYPVRHWVKPGMTGLAQVRGLRGDSSDHQQFEARIEADIYYIEHWSMWLDLAILVRTVIRK